MRELLRYRIDIIKARYKDSNAEILDTNTGYAAEEEGLEPGEASSFRISVPYNERIRKTVHRFMTILRIEILDEENMR